MMNRSPYATGERPVPPQRRSLLAGIEALVELRLLLRGVPAEPADQRQCCPMNPLPAESALLPGSDARQERENNLSREPLVSPGILRYRPRQEHVPLLVPRVARGAREVSAPPPATCAPAISVISSAARMAGNTRLTGKNRNLPDFRGFDYFHCFSKILR